MANVPDVDNGGYLLKCFMEVGPAMRGDSGAMPVSFQEINAWSQATSTPLTPWEANTIRKLSDDYVVQLIKSRDRYCPAPYYRDDRPVQTQRQEVEEKFRSLAKRYRKQK